MSEIGLTKGDRARLLGERIKDFNEAMYWGQPDKALSYVDQASPPEVADTLRATPKTLKVVESKIDGVDFTPDGYEATAKLTIKYFEVPYYVVRERAEEQTWKFSLQEGWLLFGRVVRPVA